MITYISLFLTVAIVLLVIDQVSNKIFQFNILILVTSFFFCITYKLFFVKHPIESSPFFQFISQIDFPDLLVNYLLSYILFTGAIHFELEHLKRIKLTVLSLAFIGTLISTVLIGVVSYFILKSITLQIPFIYCLTFGALISPTDPISVLDMLKGLETKKVLRDIIAGESLFNDGVGIVIFTTLLTIIQHTQGNVYLTIPLLFIQQSFGGLLYGFILGYIAIKLINITENRNQSEILITVWVTTAGYWLANYIGFSGPLAMVVSGIYIGNKLKPTRHTELANFWQSIDHVLNIILFFIIGFELIIYDFANLNLAIFLAVLLTCLFSRFLSVYLSLKLLSDKYKIKPRDKLIVSWGGLKGSLAIALSLILPNSPEANVIKILTYFIVIFSVVIQGSTFRTIVVNELDSARARS